jgi:murein L,D-transpeptidase YafK
LLAARQTQIGSLHEEVNSKENDIAALHQRIKVLEQNVLDFATRKRSVDRILIEKKERRLMLISKGEVLKIYKIALGGNPDGPKEKQGDNKTPEGTYVIDAKNKNSRYHQSLHISYPNERDKKRAKELGVSPGGDIMIHGITAGFSWVGDLQADSDWTKGCIAVTDEEIEEIYKLAPLNTVVEIRP